MKLLNIIALTAYLPLTLSKVTFKLITPVGNPSVVVDGKSYSMKKAEFPVYEVEVDKNAPLSYHYKIDYTGTKLEAQGVEEESITRKLEKGKETTLNEYFNRAITVKTHPKLPRAYQAYPGYSASKLYDDTHVSTVMLYADAKEIEKLNKDPTNEDLKVYGGQFIYATPHSVRSFQNVTIGISGQSTVYAAKLSYKISNLKNEKKKELYKRTGIKLRAEHMDPSFLRDKIYTDILNSLGVPTPQSKFTRLFINDEPIGLFVLSDNVNNKRYLRETLNNGVKWDVNNYPFKADYFPPTAYGDLGYYGPSSDMYGIYYFKGEDDDAGNINVDELNDQMVNSHVIPFLKEISDYPKTKILKFDLEMFLKFMAAEYIAGAVDNYWARPGNFFIFKNMNFNNGYWYFLDSDFHYSFGIGSDATMEYLNSTIDNYASINSEVDPSRPLLDNIRSIAKNDSYFKNVFSRLLSTAFNTAAIFPRIDSLAELIRDDVEWDFTLPRVSKYPDAEDFKPTMDEFNIQTKNEDSGGRTDELPLKFWIRERGLNLAAELGIDYPANVDYSLGSVDTLVQTSDASATVTIFPSNLNNPNSKSISNIFIRNSRNLFFIMISSFLFYLIN